MPIAAILILVTLTFDLEETVKLNTFRAQVVNGILYAILLLSIGIQAYRYQKYYTPLERQQTKWVLYGAAVWFGMGGMAAIPYFYVLNLPPGTPIPWWDPPLGAVWWLTLNILPISFTFAILRARLWDIDILIRRTVTYAIVVALLGIVYFGSVILLQQIFAQVTGQRSEIITILSTLAIAALFVPLRKRIQDAIDTRFNRKKYDAQKVLQKFAETVRDETDLDKLTAELVKVVQETMQPKSVSLWLKRTEDDSPKNGLGRRTE